MMGHIRDLQFSPSTMGDLRNKLRMPGLVVKEYSLAQDFFFYCKLKINLRQ